MANDARHESAVLGGLTQLAIGVGILHGFRDGWIDDLAVWESNRKRALRSSAAWAGRGSPAMRDGDFSTFVTWTTYQPGPGEEATVAQRYLEIVRNSSIALPAPTPLAVSVRQCPMWSWIRARLALAMAFSTA